MAALRQTLIQTTLLAALAMGLGAMTVMVTDRPPRWVDAPRVTVDDIRLVPPPIIWIDARTATQRRAQPAPAAVWMSEDDWDGSMERLMQTWSSDATMVVFCASGSCQSSASVARRITDTCGSPTYVLDGGWSAFARLRAP